MIRSMLRPDSQIEELKNQFPEAAEFLSFRSFVIQTRRTNKSPHGHRVEWIQPRDAKNWSASTDAQYFSVANWLFWGTLFSEIVFSDYRSYYTADSMNKQLLFPEIRGDCLSSCRYHLDPYEAVFQCLPSNSERFVPDAFAVKLEGNISKWLEIISGESPNHLPTELRGNVYAKCLEYYVAERPRGVSSK